MLWDSSTNAGFSSAQPWIKVNERYPQINVQEQLSRPDSCLRFYKKLFHLRKSLDEVFDSEFILLEESNPDTFSYLRKGRHGTIAVICNFKPHAVSFSLGRQFENAEILLSNTEHTYFHTRETLDAFDAYVIRVE